MKVVYEYRCKIQSLYRWLVLAVLLLVGSSASASSMESLLLRSVMRCWMHKMDGQSSDWKLLYFVYPDCPLSQTYTLDINAIEDSLDEVQVCYVMPSKIYKMEEVRVFQEKYHVKSKYVFDPDNFLCRAYDVHTVPTCVLIDGENRVLYYGKVDDRATSITAHLKPAQHHYLADAIDAVLRGEQVMVPYTVPVGCIVE